MKKENLIPGIILVCAILFIVGILWITFSQSKKTLVDHPVLPLPAVQDQETKVIPDVPDMYSGVPKDNSQETSQITKDYQADLKAAQGTKSDVPTPFVLFTSSTNPVLTPHVIFKNTGTQTKLDFAFSGSVMSRFRADSPGNLNYHAPGYHAFYNSLDNEQLGMSVESGRVGVGLLNPTQALDVLGGIRFANAETANRVQNYSSVIKPKCDEYVRGTMWFTRSNTGDMLEVCRFTGNSYVWSRVAF